MLELVAQALHGVKLVYREPEKTEYEKAVDYDGWLLMAADEVLSRLEERVYEDEAKRLVRVYARTYNVTRRDLRLRVKELL